MGKELDILVRTPWSSEQIDDHKLRTALSQAVGESRVSIASHNSSLANGFDRSEFAPPDVVMTLGKPVPREFKHYLQRFCVPRLGVEATPNGDVQKSCVVLPGEDIPSEGYKTFFAGSFYSIDTHAKMFHHLFERISREKIMQLGDINKELFHMSKLFHAAPDVSPDGLNQAYHQLLDERRDLEKRLKVIAAGIEAHTTNSRVYASGWAERSKLLGRSEE